MYVRMLAGGTKAYVAVHVDDFGIAASTPALKQETMDAIRTSYNCAEGDLGAYLGMQLVRDRVKRSRDIWRTCENNLILLVLRLHSHQW